MSKDSNIMGFHSIKNKPHFNTFNLDRRNLFTAKIGQLLPIFCEEVIPGDVIKIDMQHFSRSMPVQTAAFTRLKENIQFFFVPYSALWSFYREAMMNVPSNQSGLSNSMRATNAFENVELSTKLPSFNTKCIYDWFSLCSKAFSSDVANNVGGSHALRISESARLLQSLGYGNFTNISKLYRDNEVKPTKLMLDGSPVPPLSAPTTNTGVRVSPFRLLAYHKIANDFYRYSKWEEYVACSCNVDYVSQENPLMDADLSQSTFNYWLNDENTSYLFDMEYSRLPLDRFNGGLPKAQFGDESVVPLKFGHASGSASLSGTTSTDSNHWSVSSAHPSDPVVVSNTSNNLACVTDGNHTEITHNHSISADVSINTDLNGSLSILELRKSTALQRYKEIQECNDADFCSQIEAHFGVKPNSHGTKSKFIGGYSSVFD